MLEHAKFQPILSHTLVLAGGRLFILLFTWNGAFFLGKKNRQKLLWVNSGREWSQP